MIIRISLSYHGIRLSHLFVYLTDFFFRWIRTLPLFFVYFHAPKRLTLQCRFLQFHCIFDYTMISNSRKWHVRTLNSFFIHSFSVSLARSPSIGVCFHNSIRIHSFSQFNHMHTRSLGFHFISYRNGLNGILSTGDNAEWISYLFIQMAFIRSIEKSNAHYFPQNEKRERKRERKNTQNLFAPLSVDSEMTRNKSLITEAPRSCWTNVLLWNVQRKKAQHHTENYAQLIKS